MGPELRGNIVPEGCMCVVFFFFGGGGGVKLF